MKQLTVNRLRKLPDDMKFTDFKNREFDKDDMWSILESDEFDNDSERNSWLKVNGFKISIPIYDRYIKHAWEVQFETKKV